MTLIELLLSEPPDVNWRTLAPYVAAVIALAVGIITPIVSSRTAARTARETLRTQRELATASFENQRQLANDERLWHKRATTYVELLEWAGNTRIRFAELADGDDGPLRGFAEDIELPVQLDSMMVAYSSGPVYAAAKEFVQHLQIYAHLTADLRADLATADQTGRQEIEALQIRYSADEGMTANYMAQLVSDDLHGLVSGDFGRPQPRASAQPTSNRPDTPTQQD